MQYTFEILGVTPILDFFNQQQLIYTKNNRGIEYLGTHKCSLDAFIESLEIITIKPSWDHQKIIQTMIKFWMENAEIISYWKSRLDDSGKQNLLIGKVADIEAIRHQFETLL
jgi:hypothetical protein